MGGIGEAKEKLPGANFMFLKIEGEDKALTLPSNSSHPFTTRTITVPRALPKTPH